MAGRLLTDTSVKAEIERVMIAGKRTDVSDRGIRGLVLRVTPTGAATFVFAYRPKGATSTQRVMIGRYPSCSLAKARQIAKTHSEAVAIGTDVIGERRAERAAAAKAEVEKASRVTVEDAVERYLRQKIKKETTRRNFKNMFDNDVIPAIGKLAVADVTKQDMQRIIDRIEDRGAVRQAGLALSIVRAMLNWCVGRGYMDGNPIAGLKNSHPSEPRDRFLSVHEIRAFWRLLPELNLHEPERDILRLQILLGQRVGEVAGMMRHEIDIARKVWVLPKERVKNDTEHEVPLPPMSREIIERAMRNEKGRLLFPRPNGTRIKSAVLAVGLQRVQLSLGFKAPDGTPNPIKTHDLRRTLASWLEQSGTPTSVVSLILNHRDKKGQSVTQSHYLHGDTLKAKRLGLTTWEKHMRTILAGEDPFAMTFDDADAIEAELLKDAPEMASSSVVAFRRPAW